MIAILEKLKSGSTNVGPIYKECVDLWDEVLANAAACSDEDLAQKLSLLQMEMVKACGMDHHLGKTITAHGGFPYLYDDRAGFGDNRRLAKRLLKAFDLSGVSIEVKSMVAQAARIFNLDVW